MEPRFIQWLAENNKSKDILPIFRTFGHVFHQTDVLQLGVTHFLVVGKQGAAIAAKIYSLGAVQTKPRGVGSDDPSMATKKFLASSAPNFLY